MDWREVAFLRRGDTRNCFVAGIGKAAWYYKHCPGAGQRRDTVLTELLLCLP